MTETLETYSNHQASIIWNRSFLPTIKHFQKLSLKFHKVTRTNLFKMITSIQTQPKTDIQRKLENWKPPRSSLTSLKARLSGASRRRETKKNQVISLAAARFQRAKKVSVEVASKQKDEEEMLVENIEKKLRDASQRKEDLNAQNVSTIKDKQYKKVMKVDLKRAEDIKNEQKAKVALDEKLLNGRERKESTLAEKVLKVSAANQLVASRVCEEKRNRETTEREMFCKYENKLASSSKRKELNRSPNSQFNDKVERVKHHKLAQDADQSLRKREIDEKMESAVRRREEKLNERINKAANSNNIVSKRVQDVLTSREDRAKELRFEHQMKLRRHSSGDLVIKGQKALIQSEKEAVPAVDLGKKMEEAAKEMSEANAETLNKEETEIESVEKSNNELWEFIASKLSSIVSFVKSLFWK